MRRWGHMHTLATGFLGGLLLIHNGWLLLVAFGLVFAFGWVARAFRDRIAAAAHTAGELVQERVRTERERRKKIRSARRRDLEQARDRRVDRERRETARYWQGVRDGTP